MDRGVVHVLEDEEEDKKPIIGGALALGEHRSMAGASNATAMATFHPLQSSAGMAHNLQPMQPTFGQITGIPSQEKSEGSTSTTLQQPLPQFMPQQQGGAQQGDKGQSSNLIKRPGGPAQAISFGTLMPMLLPILQPDKAQKLNSLYLRLKRSEITKEDFLRATRMLVGDQLLVATVKQMQIKQQQMQGQMPRQQPSAQAEVPQQLPFPQQMQHMQQQQQQQQQQHHQQQQQQQQQQHQQQQQQQQAKASLEQLQQHRPQAQDTGQFHSQQPLPQMQSSMETSMHYQANTRVPPMPMLQSEYRQEHWQQAPPASSSLNLQQVKGEVDKPQVGESSIGHGSAAVNTSTSLNAQPGNSPLMPSTMAALPVPLNTSDGVPSLTNVASGGQVRTPPKRASSDQKKSADVSPMTQGKSKKQKVAGDDLEQSIDQLNDVTAVSGVNLREEEEQLLAGPKEESRSTQAMRRFAQEEEGRLFLERGPLRTKLNAIATKHGVSIVSEEAEQCLSMSVEERLRNMLYKLTKISSRRCDQEKEMHKLVVTSDIQKQILLIRKKAKEAFEKKQAIESERLKKINEEKEKASQNEGASKEDGTATQKKEKKKGEDGKQKASAASMAARSANDMLLKWQMMAEQGRQKREGETGTTTASDTSAVNSGGATNISGRELDKKHGNLEAKQSGRAITTDGGLATTGQGSLKKASGDFGFNRGFAHQASLLNHQPAKPLCPITAKDIIAYLETEPQMAKSPLIYRLYDKNLASSQAV